MQLSPKAANGHGEIYIQVGYRIRQARKAARLTQEKLAKRVSLTRTSVTNIEKGRQKLLVHTLADLARELDIPVAKLLPDKHIQRHIEDKLPKNFSFEERDFVASVVGLPKKK
jgi:transcriptional regulator with XRE-family HTH domain